MKKIVSSTERSGSVHSKEMSMDMSLLLKDGLVRIDQFTRNVIEFFSKSKQLLFSHSNSNSSNGLVMECLKGFEPHLLLSGEPSMGQTYLQSHLMSIFEKSGFLISNLELACILSKTCLLLFYSLLTRVRSEPTVIIATSTTRILPEELNSFFQQPEFNLNYSWKLTIDLNSPSDECRRAYFKCILNDVPFSFTKMRQQEMDSLVSLPLGDPNIETESFKAIVQDQQDQQLREEEQEELFSITPDEKEHLIREIEKHKLCSRQYFSLMIEDLRKNYRAFARPVDRQQNPEYNPEHPMDLGTMEEKVLNNEYETIEDVMKDINLIIHNVELYNDPEIPFQKENILKALKLRDAAEEHFLLLPRDFVQSCWLFKLLSAANAKQEASQSPQGVPQVIPQGIPVGMETDNEDIRPGSSFSIKKFRIDDEEEEEDEEVVENAVDHAVDQDQIMTFPSVEPMTIQNNSSDSFKDSFKEQQPEIIQIKLTPYQESVVQELIDTLTSRTKDKDIEELKQIGIGIASVVFSNHSCSLDELFQVILFFLLLNLPMFRKLKCLFIQCESSFNFYLTLKSYCKK